MKNKVLKFTYTKDNGEVSKRKVITIAEPTDLLLCADISEVDAFEELSPETIKIVLSHLADIERDRLNSIYALLNYYGINNVKTFKNKGISDKTDETKKYEIKEKDGLG